MKIQSSRVNNALFAIIWLIITLVENYYIENVFDNGNGLKYISILIILNVIMQLFSFRLFNQRIFSFFFAFLIFMYLFHFGQIISASLLSHIQFDMINYVDTYMENKESVLKTIKICLNTINLFFIGGIFAWKHRSVKQIDTIEGEKSNAFNICLVYGKILFAITSPFKLYSDLQRFVSAYNNGYSGVLSNQGMSIGVFSELANMWYIAVLIMVVGLASKKKEKMFVICCILYMIFTMLSGGRGHQTICIMCIIIILIYKHNIRIDLKRLLIFVVIGLISMLFVDLIFDMRKYSISYFFSHFNEMIVNVLRKNIVFETINSFGATIYTPYLVVDGMGTQYNPFFGETFVKSMVRIVPAITDSMRNINNSAVLGRSLNTHHAIGGSFAGELYYSFRDFYPIFACIFGYYYCRLSISFYNAFVKKKASFICFSMPILMCPLWWIRDSFANLVRSVIWLSIGFIVLKNYRNKKIGKTNTNTDLALKG